MMKGRSRHPIAEIRKNTQAMANPNVKTYCPLNDSDAQSISVLFGSV
jgi:hypothetical protein